MAKKQASARAKKKNEVRSYVILLVVLIIVVSAGFAAAQYFGGKHRVLEASDEEIHRFHGFVRNIGESEIQVEIDGVEEGEGRLFSEDIVPIPTSSINETTLSYLQNGMYVTVYYEGDITRFNGVKHFEHIHDLVTDVVPSSTVITTGEPVADNVTVDATGESNTFQIVASDSDGDLSYEITPVDEAAAENADSPVSATETAENAANAEAESTSVAEDVASEPVSEVDTAVSDK